MLRMHLQWDHCQVQAPLVRPLNAAACLPGSAGLLHFATFTVTLAAASNCTSHVRCGLAGEEMRCNPPVSES